MPMLLKQLTVILDSGVAPKPKIKLETIQLQKEQGGYASSQNDLFLGE